MGVTYDVDAAIADVALLTETIADDPALVAGDRETLADRLALLDRVNAALNGAAGHVTDTLAELMESNDERIGRWWVTRKRRWSRTRDQAAAREDGARVIVTRLALDRTTGTLDPVVARIAGEAVAEVMRSFSVNLTYSGLKALGLDPDEYEAKQAAGWAVNIADHGEPNR